LAFFFFLLLEDEEGFFFLDGASAETLARCAPKDRSWQQMEMQWGPRNRCCRRPTPQPALLPLPLSSRGPARPLERLCEANAKAESISRILGPTLFQ
jgi:hypothetical protein